MPSSIASPLSHHPTRPVDLPGLLSPAELELAIAKERMRADRHRFEFSLIVIRVVESNPKIRQRKNHELSKILSNRLRLTDERGVDSRGDVILVLPHTGRGGSQLLLDDLVELASRKQIAFNARIFVYPDRAVDELDLLPHRSADPPNDDRPDATEASGERSSIPVTFSRDHFGGNSVKLVAPRYPLWKRVFDILFAVIGLVLASPILLLAAIAIRLNSSGPIFFRQWRTGQHSRPFQILKLRTMVVQAEELKSQLQRLNERDGPAFKMKNDPRVTSVGRFLRATGIDELPQLWNVLVGDMAIVGPRPLPCDEDAACELWQRRRLDTKPGITCFWQILSSRDVPFDHWMRLDLRYVSKRSVWLDLRLVAKTVATVFRGRVGH